jgi:F-type H+-transporting ATPase subunit gamma
MSETSVGLRRKISTAGDLQSVVKSMKALAAASINQYDKSVRALTDYYRTVELGLGVCFRKIEKSNLPVDKKTKAEVGTIGIIVFGSDQGLVGQFNEIVSDYAIQKLKGLQGIPEVWAVGERVRSRLVDADLSVVGHFNVPNSVNSISSLVGQLQIKTEANRVKGEYASVYVFHNRPVSAGIFEPVSQRLLPLDEKWRQSLLKVVWPGKNIPEILDNGTTTLHALIREYLFISLFRACAESLASENASRLSAMDRADKNIDELLEQLKGASSRLRQGTIDEELFDVVSGFEALSRMGKT